MEKELLAIAKEYAIKSNNDFENRTIIVSNDELIQYGITDYLAGYTQANKDLQYKLSSLRVGVWNMFMYFIQYVNQKQGKQGNDIYDNSIVKEFFKTRSESELIRLLGDKYKDI